MRTLKQITKVYVDGSFYLWQNKYINYNFIGLEVIYVLFSGNSNNAKTVP